MPLTDDCGLAVSLESPAALGDWNACMRAFLAHGRETPEALARVLAAEPDFALGWAAKGLFMALLGRAELLHVAREAEGRARAALARAGGTPRERAHVAALSAWLAGRPSEAARHFSATLARDPGDALAMKLDHLTRFVLGDRRGMARMIETVAPAYDPGHPFAGYAAGCRAFALEETGRFAEAEATGRAGLGRAPDDAWGLHAVAHVYDMTARTAEGVAWLSGQEARWAHCNNFGYHVWWHLGLFHLDRGEYDRVMDLYDARIRPESTDDYRDVANAASMLTRLEIEGVDVGTRWEELASRAAGRVEDGCLVFADLHYLLALEAAGRRAEADRLVARLAEDAARSDHDMHEVAAVAGHPAALGLAAFRAGHYALAHERLSRVRADLGRIGGSHAQRDVFTRLSVEAAMRAGRLDAAEAEIHARAARRGAEDGFTARRLAAIAEARAHARTAV